MIRNVKKLGRMAEAEGVNALDISIMTYGSLAFTPGVENFVKMCKDAGVSAGTSAVRITGAAAIEEEKAWRLPLILRATLPRETTGGP